MKTIINEGSEGNDKANTCISQVLQRIYEMQAVPALRDHAKSLLGPRTRGSTTTWGLENVDAMRPKSQSIFSTMAFEVELPSSISVQGCRYFRFSEPYLEGTMGARPLSKVLAAQEKVSVRNGAHGYELYIDRPPGEASGHVTCEHYIVLGHDKTGNFPEVVYTWHPGRPLAPASMGLCDFTGVKEHNG